MKKRGKIRKVVAQKKQSIDGGWKWSIKSIVIINFLVIAVLIGVVGFISNTISKNALEDTMLQSTLTTNQIKEIYSPLESQRNFLILMSLGAGILSILTGLFVSYRISKPLAVLAKSDEDITKGLYKKAQKNHKQQKFLPVEILDLTKARKVMVTRLLNKEESLVKEKKKIEKINAQLTESNKLKDFFIDIMNHDILNPVGSIRSLADTIVSKEKNPKRKNIIKRIYASSDRTIKMIQNAHSLSRLQSGEKIKFEKKDVGSILKKAAEDVEQRAKGKNMKIIVDCKRDFPAMVNSLMYNVFFNLITNAVKYAPEKTKINVNIKKKDSILRVEVSDQGEGIKDKYKKAIFMRFTRLEKGAIKGSGLGLAITKKIVEVHKGKVWVENNKPKGSVFVVEIPTVIK